MASLFISSRKEECLFLAFQILEARWNLWGTRTYHLIFALLLSINSQLVAYRFYYRFPCNLVLLYLFR